MEVKTVRELGDAELREASRNASEQLFRIRFQVKLGQNEGVKKLRSLKKDIARLKTIARERALGLRAATAIPSSAVRVKNRKQGAN